MRRRPLRTSLTGITVVLMTFILLTFASFNPSAGARRIALNVTPTHPGILLRRPSWLPFADGSEQRVAETWGSHFDIHTQRWLTGEFNEGRFPLESAHSTGVVEAIIGTTDRDPSSLSKALLRGPEDSDTPRGFGADDDWIFLPANLLESMRLTPGVDTIMLRGITLRVGALDPGRLLRTTYLDGDPITPLRVSTVSDEERYHKRFQLELAATGQDFQEPGGLIHLGPDSVAVIHDRIMRRLKAPSHSFTLVPMDEETVVARRAQGLPAVAAAELELAEMANDIAQQLALTLRVGERGETYLLTGVGGLDITGLSDVLIPLILGGMIIFSTMLGSVAERGKEIFIYASLGLAPLHIAALFLVEAAIYAVLGGMGGYILAQAMASMLGLMADLGIGTRPDLNFSSFTAVATIVTVICTVLLSAIYPALVASRAARPGEERDFRVPQPDGDQMKIAFPFTVAARDVRGLLAFLKLFFDANTESSTGCFTAAQAEMGAEDTLGWVSATIWLAPFDLGISQSFRMNARQTEVKAIYAIDIELKLLSGQRSAWRRVLRPFIQNLRQQFLVWRTLDQETTDRYRAAGGDQAAISRLAAATTPIPEISQEVTS